MFVDDVREKHEYGNIISENVLLHFIMKYSSQKQQA